MPKRLKNLISTSVTRRPRVQAPLGANFTRCSSVGRAMDCSGWVYSLFNFPLAPGSNPGDENL